MLAQILRPCFISGFLAKVRLPIQFDDESTFMTHEIGDERPNPMLSSKLEAVEAMGAQVFP
jgi:hypothetical protein